MVKFQDKLLSLESETINYPNMLQIVAKGANKKITLT